MGRLDNRICIVTGSAQGIGAAIAHAYRAEGAALALVDRDGAALAETAAVLKAMPGAAPVVAIEADVADEQSVEAAFAEARNAIGPAEVLVNNAGVITYGTVEEMPVTLWDQMMAVNLRSMFLCSRAVMPDMRRRGWGRIINMSSQLAHIGAANLAHYAAAKAGVLGFTRAFAREAITHGITVNAICPGPIDTALSRTNDPAWRESLIAEIPAGRYGETQEIAPSAVMLACEDAGYFVGSSINPNGGHAML